jgi:hypothetical protein
MMVVVVRVNTSCQKQSKECNEYHLLKPHATCSLFILPELRTEFFMSIRNESWCTDEWG